MSGVGPFYAGIDPGLKGACVVLDATGQIVGSTGPWCDLWEMVTQVHEAIAGRTAYVAIEEQQSDARWGRRSIFTFGRICGALEAVATLAAARYRLVRPRDWQKQMFRSHDHGGPKQRALTQFRRLWPSYGGRPHDGIVDAALIAEWLRRQEQAA